MLKSTFKYLLVSGLMSAPITAARAEENVNLLKEFVKKLAEEKAQSQPTAEALDLDLGNTAPLGELPAPVPPECHPQQFQKQALVQYQNPRRYAQFTQSYFQKCSKFLTAGNSQGLPGLLKFANTKYNLDQNPHIHRQVLTLSDGTKIESFIGVKDLREKRPWVIAKCGVFCDISTSNSSVNFIINYFDQSPFNFIFISNHTGEIHIRANASLTLGGLYEMYDLYDIARWLKFESHYKETVDSIHSVGVSLGGSTALAVSHLSQLFRSPDGRPLFNSTTAICPVVNMGPTLNDMYSDSFKGKIFTQYTWSYLRKAAPYLPLASDYLSKKNPPPAHQFPRMLADIVVRYGSQWDMTSPPHRVVDAPKTVEEFLQFNNFASDTQPLDIPTLAWASQDDHIVNYDLNTKTLIESPNPKDNLGALGLAHGDHCGFDTAYGFTATTMVLQTFILANSPSYLAQRQVKTLNVPAKSLALKSGDVHLRQWWVAEPLMDSLTLHYETFNSNRGLVCRWADPFSSHSSCRKIATTSVPLVFLKTLGLEKPKTPTEAEILSRKLNGLLRLTQASQPIDGTTKQPDQLSWYSYSPSI